MMYTFGTRKFFRPKIFKYLSLKRIEEMEFESFQNERDSGEEEEERSGFRDTLKMRFTLLVLVYLLESIFLEWMDSWKD